MRLASGMLLLATMAGCSYTVTVRSSPSGARVFLDGSLVGVTPLEHEVSVDVSSYVLRVEHDGYEPETKVVSPEVRRVFMPVEKDLGPPPKYDFDDPGASNLAALDYAARSSRATMASMVGQQVHEWPTEFFFHLRPAPAAAWQRTPAPAPRPTAMAPPRTAPARSTPPPPPVRTAAPPPAPRAAAFCGSCGARLGGGRYCGGCGIKVDAIR